MSFNAVLLAKKGVFTSQIVVGPCASGVNAFVEALAVKFMIHLSERRSDTRNNFSPGFEAPHLAWLYPQLILTDLT